MSHEDEHDEDSDDSSEAVAEDCEDEAAEEDSDDSSEAVAEGSEDEAAGEDYEAEDSSDGEPDQDAPGDESGASDAGDPSFRAIHGDPQQRRRFLLWSFEDGSYAAVMLLYAIEAYRKRPRRPYGAAIVLCFLQAGNESGLEFSGDTVRTLRAVIAAVDHKYGAKPDAFSDFHREALHSLGDAVERFHQFEGEPPRCDWKKYPLVKRVVGGALGPVFRESLATS